MILTDIINGLGGGILSGVSDLIKGTNTTDKERLALQNEATRIVSAQLAKADAQLVAYEQELTKRQANDMQSDSWLSKNVGLWYSFSSLRQPCFWRTSPFSFCLPTSPV